MGEPVKSLETPESKSPSFSPSHPLIFRNWTTVVPTRLTGESKAHRPFKGQATHRPDLAPPLLGRTAPAPHAGALGLGRSQFRATFK